MAPMLAANLAGAALLRRAVEKPVAAGRRARLAGERRSRRRGLRLERAQRRERTAQALRYPGTELQRVIGTREPSEAQLEVGRAALAEILRAEGAPPDPRPAVGARQAAYRKLPRRRWCSLPHLPIIRDVVPDARAAACA